MSIDTVLVILLVWTVAGLLAAIAFGKAIQEPMLDEENGLASTNAPGSRHGAGK
jgi:hypothetical protein